MADYEDVELEDIQTIDEYFEEFGNDKNALKYLIGLFLDQVFDLQEFIQENGHTAEEFFEWQKAKEKKNYH
jgi:hypothetical protein